MKLVDQKIKISKDELLKMLNDELNQVIQEEKEIQINTKINNKKRTYKKELDKIVNDWSYDDASHEQVISIKNNIVKMIDTDGIPGIYDKIKEYRDSKFNPTGNRYKMVSDMLKVFEDFQNLNEISWQGLKNVGNLAKQAIGNTGQNIVDKTKETISNVSDKVNKTFNTTSTYFKNIYDSISDEMTKGDIDNLESKILGTAQEISFLVSKINDKRIKLGLPPTKTKSVLLSIMNKIR